MNNALASFKPTPWLRNRHLQTLWGALYPITAPRLLASELELADGDAVGLLATGPIAGKDVVMILHGLEGSADSSYVRYLLRMLAERGACGILLQARGAAQRPNRLARNYHSGDWQDAAALAQYAFDHGARSVSAIGISLGANQLLKWLGETGDTCQLRWATAISPPFNLDVCANSFNYGFARIYQHHLIYLMRASMLAKSQLLPFSRRRLQAMRSIREFDALITAPLHGFIDVDDYYRRCSCRQFLPTIKKPCLIIHATDDPFVPQRCIPQAHELSATTTLQLSPHGGHVGFLSGVFPRPWLPQIISDWIDRQL